MIENRVVFGSVNAHRTDWVAAVEALEAMQRRWPDAMEQLVGLRVEPDRFSEAFGYRGVKATLRFCAQSRSERSWIRMLRNDTTSFAPPCACRPM